MLYEKLKLLRPELKDTDVFLQQDNEEDGPYIREWLNPNIKQPTQAEIDAVTTEQVEAYRAGLIAEQELKASDADMARVIEDLIAELDKKGVLLKSQLPQPVQDKLFDRSVKRAKL